MPHIRDGGAELGGGGIIMRDRAEILAQAASPVGTGGGLYCFKLACANLSIGPIEFTSEIQWNTVPVLPGVEYRIKLRAQSTFAGAGTEMLVWWSDSATGGAGFSQVGSIYQAILPPGGWRASTSEPFIPSGTAIAIMLTTPIPLINNSGIWYADDVVLEAEMAVMLSEFSIRAVINYLQANLNTEINHVKNEANLGKDLPAVGAWYAFPRQVPSPDVVAVEVYEQSTTEFPLKERDMSLYAAGSRSRAISRFPAVIALTHANRGDAANSDATLLESDMAERSRLYAAALYRTIRNNPNVGYVDRIIVWPLAMKVFAGHQSVDPNTRRVARVEYYVTIDQQEDSINETVVGGASLPAITAETP